MGRSDLLDDLLDKVVDGTNADLAEAAVSVLDEVDCFVDSVLDELLVQRAAWEFLMVFD